MLNVVSINNQSDVSIYTVPSGKRAMIFIDVHPLLSSVPVTVKINSYEYCNLTISDDISIKLALTSGDVVTCSSTGQLNVFVHGMEF